MRKIKKISILALISILLLSLAACNNQAAEKEEKDKELAEKIDSIAISYSDTKEIENNFKDMSDEEREKLFTDINEATDRYFSENKNFDLRKTIEDQLEKNNISPDKADCFRIYLFSDQALDSKKYNIELSNAQPSYAYNPNEGDPYFPNTSEQEILESFKKLYEYSTKEAKKGNSVKLTPEIMDKLGIEHYDKEKIEEMKFQYVYYMDVK